MFRNNGLLQRLRAIQGQQAVLSLTAVPWSFKQLMYLLLGYGLRILEHFAGTLC